jgi:LacI family transcriptional regulator
MFPRRAKFVDDKPARRPSRDRPPHVALIIETSTSYGRRLFQGISHYIRVNGPWSVYLEQRSIYDPPPPWLKKWDGDGIISRAAYPEIAQLVRNLRIPTVDLNEQVLGLGLPLIFNDHEAIGRMAADHLLERGFRRFAFLGHPGIYWSEGRLRGFRRAVEVVGSTCEEHRGTGKTLRRYHQRSWEKEMEQVAAWVRGLPKPVGIMAANDFRAVQLLDACRRVGVAVPEEAAVIGVDNEDVACQMASPPLSSVVPDALHIGYEAAALLDTLMQRRSPPYRELYVPPVGIVTRRSTEATALSDPLVAEAMQFIRNGALQGIGVNDVLRRLVVSRSTLQRRFHQALHRTIYDAILAERLRKIKELLVETGLDRSAIAARTGFRHPEYLSHVFHKETGLTLRNYRRKYSALRERSSNSFGKNDDQSTRST